MKDQQKRITLAAAIVAGLILLVGYWLLNRPYGQTSELGYEYAVALFSACNRADEATLQKIAEMVSASLDNGELQPREANWLLNIVEQGEAGEWEAASQEVRRLMEDQLQRAAPLRPTE